MLSGLQPRRKGAGTGALNDQLCERTREDFAAGRTVKLGGWLLAESEVAVCIAAAQMTNVIE